MPYRLPTPDPHPDEIAERAAHIRDGWDRNEERRRRGAPYWKENSLEPVTVEVPVVSVISMPAGFV